MPAWSDFPMAVPLWRGKSEIRGSFSIEKAFFRDAPPFHLHWTIDSEVNFWIVPPHFTF
jgi:hypothetical protein